MNTVLEFLGLIFIILSVVGWEWRRHLKDVYLGTTNLMAPRSGHWGTFKREHERLVPKECIACGRTDGVIELHHVIPFSTKPALECDHDNVVWLCEDGAHECHFYFGHGKNYKGYNVHVREDAAIFRARVKESFKLAHENH